MEHRDSFTEVGLDTEPGVPTNVADDWPTHRGNPIEMARESSEPIACLSTTTGCGQPWTLVLVIAPNDAGAPVGRYFGKGSGSDFCNGSGGATVADLITEGVLSSTPTGG